MAVRIIVDSGADLVSSDHAQLEVLPLSVAFGSSIYEDGVTLSRERFYEMLVESDELPTTGQVTPYAFEQAGRAALEAGDDVLFMAVSSKLSGTFHGADTAAQILQPEFEAAGRTVRAFDTLTVAMGENVLVKYALRLVDEGMSVDEIFAELERVRDRVVLVALLDTLEYLKRGGRISAVAGTIGELLSFKPVVGVKDGEVVMLGKARGSKNGRNLLYQEMEAAGGIDYSMPVSLGYTGMSKSLLHKYLRDSSKLWEDHFTEDSLPVGLVGATIGTHVGPGAIALAFFKQD